MRHAATHVHEPRVARAGAVLGAFVLVTATASCERPVRASAPAACPDDMTEAEGYCIDRYEASLVEVDGGGAHSPFEAVSGKAVRAVSVVNVVPQGYISREEAERACKASRKRLCTGE